jgi:hypothetical protein
MTLTNSMLDALGYAIHRAGNAWSTRRKYVRDNQLHVNVATISALVQRGFIAFLDGEGCGYRVRITDEGRAAYAAARSVQ